MNRPNAAAGIAGLCFLGCIAIGALAYVMTWIRVYGPIVREVILATLTPQFAAGMFFGIGLVLFGALLIAWGDR